MQFLLELRLADDQEALKDIMRKSVPTTMQDVVLVFVTVSGMRGGAYVQEVFTRKIFASAPAAPAEAVSAIQITTAAGICAALTCSAPAAAAAWLHPPGNRWRCRTFWPTASAWRTSSRAASNPIS